MSFILKALKKSQRERELRGPKTPQLRFDHAATPERTKSWWPWVLAVTFGANVVLVGYLFWPQGQVKLAQMRLHELVPGAATASTMPEVGQPVASAPSSDQDELTVREASPTPKLPVEPPQQQREQQAALYEPDPDEKSPSGDSHSSLSAAPPSPAPRPEDEAVPTLIPEPATKELPTKSDDAGGTPTVASSSRPDQAPEPPATPRPQEAKVPLEVSEARAAPESALRALDPGTDRPVAQPKPAMPVDTGTAGILQGSAPPGSSAQPSEPTLKPLPEPREVAALPKTVVPVAPEPSDSPSDVASPSAAGSHTIAALATQSDLPRLRQMSSQFRSSLPPIDISVHIFDENPTRRLVRINRKKYREGDTIDDSLRLDEITPNGVILTFDSTQFWMARP